LDRDNDKKVLKMGQLNWLKKYSIGERAGMGMRFAVEPEPKGKTTARTELKNFSTARTVRAARKRKNVFASYAGRILS